MKKTIHILSILSLPLALLAQTGSPSSRFGYGEMDDGVPGEYRAMGGVVAGVRSNHAINPSQPAAYTAGDSLSFMFDVAASVGWTNYSDANGQKNIPNGSLEYVTMQFPLWKRWIALSAGIMPYSHVNYSFALTGVAEGGDYAYDVAYSGKGGLSQVYAGLGFNLFDWFAAGANFYYVFGRVENYTSVSFKASDATNSELLRYMDMRACRTKVGAQLFHTFAKAHTIVLGATFDPKLKMGGEYLITETYSSDTAVVHTGSEMPMMWSVGGSYCWKNRFTVAADYSFQNWSNAKYFGQDGYLQDRQKIAVGMQYMHNPYGMKYEERMLWRIGASMMNNYAMGDDWQDFTVSLGFGFPLRTSATMVNTTVEYGHKQSLTGLKEHNLKLTINVAVNEQWFHKRKL
ncbi:MAG: hypothetical protein MJZ65_03500 [Paludibacteraceae bacterium]|nr:hypothetical protein [Paludibacteraceae bacterium]